MSVITIELARRAGHEEIDDVLCARGEMAGPRRHRIRQRAGGRRGEEPTVVQHRRERDTAEAHRAATEKMPAGEFAQMLGGIDWKKGRHGSQVF